MKQFITTLLGLTLMLFTKAQTTQLLTNTAHEFGFVDANKTTFYTYNDISNTNPNAAVNFELKKFDPLTNTFSTVFSMPNNQNYTKFYPLAILNGKCLFVGKYLDSIYTKRNYFTYDGFTFDSVLSSSVYDFPEYKIHMDIVKQKVYFAIVTSTGSFVKTEIYASDFTKSGTKKKFSFNDFIYPDQGLYGIDSTIYFQTSYSGEIIQLIDSTAGAIDTINSKIAAFNYTFKDEINNELYFYKGQGLISSSNDIVFKINASGQKNFLSGIPLTGNGTAGYSMLGKVANKLAFITFYLPGLVTYDIFTGQIDTLYGANSITEPIVNMFSQDVKSFFTKSNNHMYLYTNRNKMWVTDGFSIQELNSAPAYNIDSLFIPYTSEYDFNTSFCSENWICKHANGINSNKMIVYDPNTNGSNTCLQSSDPNLNCLFSSVHEVNNKTYVLSKSNLYEITNCSISTAISDLEKSEAYMDLYFSNQSIKFTQFPEKFSGSTLALKNIDGKTVFKTSIEKNKYEYAIQNEIAKGFYFVEIIYDNNAIKRKKIVVE
jgi:hypothetical protein